MVLHLQLHMRTVLVLESHVKRENILHSSLLSNNASVLFITALLQLCISILLERFQGSGGRASRLPA